MPEHRYFLCACARAVFLCGSPRGGYCVGTRGFFLFCSLQVVFLGREETLFFRGVVLLPPQAPPSTPALGACCCVLHARVFSLQFTAGRFCACARAVFLCGFLRGGYCVGTRGFFLCKLFFWGGAGCAASLQAVRQRGGGALTEYPRQVTVYVWGSGKPVTFCLYRWYLPIGNKKFPDGKILFCRLSGKNFAVGKRDTCNRQTFSLPIANEKFAVGKCLAGHRQNSLGVNGKYKFCHRQIVIF